MRNARIRPWAVALLALCTTAVWSIIIMTALHVSTVVLETLDMIVELAAISP